MSLKVVIYSKVNCGLCDEALEAVLRVQARVPFELSIVDITTLPHALMLRYRHDIPVVSVNGIEVMRHRVDERALEEHLRGMAVARPMRGPA